VKAFTVSLALAVLLLAGCSQEVDTTEAIRQGVITHLSGVVGLDLSQMDVEVGSVAFRENEADATVSFRPKGSTDAAAAMEMAYTLERQGSRWVVKKRAEGASSHGDAMLGGEMPGGEMPGGEAPAGGIPPGHPPMGESAPPVEGP